MLFHTAAQPGSGVYVEQYSCVLEGPLRVPLFQEAWQHAVERHPALRTVFLWEDLDEPLQIVRDVVALNWEVRDWQEAKPADQARRWQDFLTDDRTRGFDLSRAPLMRMALFQTEADTHRFAWSFHHLLLDGWSVINVLDEVWTDYAALCKGERASIASPRPFRDYVAWHRSQDLDVEEEYWSELLHDVERPTPLHIDQDSTGEEGRAEYTLDLSAERSAAARDFARKHRITLNTLVQGAWALLLSRYSGSDDVVYGTTVAGRPSTLQGVESMVGSFINTVPMRIEVSPSAAPATWLQEVQSTLSTVQSHAHTPLSKIQRWSPVQQGQALFDSLLVFENHPNRQHDPAREAGLRLHDEAFRGQSNYPLALLVHPRERLRFTAVYDAARFRASRIERLLGHLSQLLHSLIGGTVDQLAACAMLTADERHALLAPTQATQGTAPTGDGVSGDGVHHLITQAATRTPEAVAVYFEDHVLTYGDLDAQADALAGSLVARGVSPGDHVGLFVERTPAMVIGILGIMKAGGAYLPLDPTYPADRLQYMVDDAAAPFIVTTRPLIEQAPGGNGATDKSRTRLCLEDLLDEDAALPSTVSVNPEDPAYIMYTSGSTGTPKGVVVTHANLAFSTRARGDYYGASPDRFLLVSPFGFDSSVAGIFWTLTTGGALVLPQSGEERDLQRLGTLVHQHAVSHLLSVPSLYGLLLDHVPTDQLASLRTVIVAGEACSSALPSQHDERLPATDLYNEYGPTETTVWVTVHAVQSESPYASVPIGRPIPGACAYVLDHHQRLVPRGVPGELYVGGPGVARGYLNRPEQTAKRFISPPFNTGEVSIDGRLYRTGDRVRAHEGGLLEFLGRTDHQIKVQGHRVEPAEIQAALHKHPAVQDAVVVARSRSTEQPTRSAARPSDGGDSLPEAPSSNETRLVAYVTAHVDHEGALEPADLRTFLETQLPPPMVPALYVPMDKLPRLPSGKVDREALPAPDADAYATSQSFVAPRTPAEETLADLWADALDIETVGIHDNFFDLGGHSLLAIRLIGRVRERFQVDLPIQALFDAPTLAGMAEHIGTLQWAAEQPNRSHDAESDREEIEL